MGIELGRGRWGVGDGAGPDLLGDKPFAVFGALIEGEVTAGRELLLAAGAEEQRLMIGA